MRRLTTDADRDYQLRVGTFARITFMIGGIMLVAGMVAVAITDAKLRWGHAVHAVAGLGTALAWWRCRGPTLPRARVELIDEVLTISLGIAWAFLGQGAAEDDPIETSVMLASTYTVFARSVVIPSTFPRTLAISTLAMAPTVLVYFSRGMSFIPTATGQQRTVYLAFAVLWAVTAAVTSALNSRRIYGLREQIREMGKLGQYTLAEKLGAGGMGVVYRAHHAMLRRPAAIKLLLPERATEADLARFEREVQLTSTLSHPNTISIFDFGRSADGAFYYVMEYLDGIDLEQLVEQDGPLPAERVIRILAQVCGSLAEAHAMGLIHRDIKPANIILTERADEPDVVKVVDFGLVRPLGDKTDISNANMITGTPMYLAPEAISDAATIDGRADLYALGATGYYLLTGKPVFEAANVVEMCVKHLNEPPVPPSQRIDGVPADLERVILACLAKQREDRPADAAALRVALLACADANAFDADAARRWWQARHAKDRATPAATGTSPTVAIRWSGR